MRRLLIAALLALAACGDDPAGLSPEDVSGTWTGSNGAVSITLRLQQSGTVVTGTGDFTDGGTFGSFSVTEGFANSVDIIMTFASAGGPTSYQARIETATRMGGTLFFPANRQYTTFVLTR